MLLIQDFMQAINAVFNQQIDSGWELFLFIYNRGGWLVIFYFLLHASMEMFYIYRVGRFMSRFEWQFIAIDVPKNNEQTPKAVENIFTHLAGAHQTRDIKEKYWDGQWQEWFSFEIVGIEGYIQFIIMTEKKNRDLVESAIYAQYPDAEITEIEDYAKDFPKTYPDKDWNVWGTEFELVNNQYYPIRVYEDFEHQMAQDFKDPMAALLETFSRIGKDEYAMLQYIVFPIGQAWKEGGFKLAKELLGKKDAPKHTWLHSVLNFPVYILQLGMFGIFGGEEAPTLNPAKEKKQDIGFGTWMLTPGEVDQMKSVERKVSKIGFNCKVRFVYVAKKSAFQKGHVNFGLVGAFKQFTREDTNGLKPSYKLTGTTAHYIFTEHRKNVRRMKIMGAYKSRSAWSGKLPFVLNVEELATLWHFPVLTVRAPLLQKTGSKRSEAPMGLPWSAGYTPSPATPAAPPSVPDLPFVDEDEPDPDAIPTPIPTTPSPEPEPPKEEPRPDEPKKNQETTGDASAGQPPENLPFV